MPARTLSAEFLERMHPDIQAELLPNRSRGASASPGDRRASEPLQTPPRSPAARASMSPTSSQMSISPGGRRQLSAKFLASLAPDALGDVSPADLARAAESSPYAHTPPRSSGASGAGWAASTPPAAVSPAVQSMRAPASQLLSPPNAASSLASSRPASPAPPPPARQTSLALPSPARSARSSPGSVRPSPARRVLSDRFLSSMSAEALSSLAPELELSPRRSVPPLSLPTGSGSGSKLPGTPEAARSGIDRAAAQAARPSGHAQPARPLSARADSPAGRASAAAWPASPAAGGSHGCGRAPSPSEARALPADCCDLRGASSPRLVSVSLASEEQRSLVPHDVQVPPSPQPRPQTARAGAHAEARAERSPRLVSVSLASPGASPREPHPSPASPAAAPTSPGLGSPRSERSCGADSQVGRIVAHWPPDGRPMLAHSDEEREGEGGGARPRRTSEGHRAAGPAQVATCIAPVFACAALRPMDAQTPRARTPTGAGRAALAFELPLPPPLRGAAGTPPQPPPMLTCHLCGRPHGLAAARAHAAMCARRRAATQSALPAALRTAAVSPPRGALPSAGAAGKGLRRYNMQALAAFEASLPRCALCAAPFEPVPAEVAERGGASSRLARSCPRCAKAHEARCAGGGCAASPSAQPAARLAAEARAGGAASRPAVAARRSPRLSPAVSPAVGPGGRVALGTPREAAAGSARRGGLDEIGAWDVAACSLATPHVASRRSPPSRSGQERVRAGSAGWARVACASPTAPLGAAARGASGRQEAWEASVDVWHRRLSVQPQDLGAQQPAAARGAHSPRSAPRSPTRGEPFVARASASAYGLSERDSPPPHSPQPRRPPSAPSPQPAARYARSAPQPGTEAAEARARLLALRDEARRDLEAAERVHAARAAERAELIGGRRVAGAVQTGAAPRALSPAQAAAANAASAASLAAAAYAAAAPPGQPGLGHYRSHLRAATHRAEAAHFARGAEPMVVGSAASFGGELGAELPPHLEALWARYDALCAQHGAQL